MTTPDDLEQAATRIAAILGDDGLLVGGLAVSAWGYVRATDDIHFVARLAVTDVVERLKAAGISTRVLKGSVLDADIERCVKGRVGGVVFDILPPVVPLEFERAVTLDLGQGASVRVADLDGLLRLKLKAAGPQDLLDAAQLLRKHPEMLERVRPVAEAYGEWERLEGLLNDPRLR